MRPQIPDVTERFHQYWILNPIWGSLHIVLEDGNVNDNNVEFCHKWAVEHGDIEGVKLALILLKMSKTQRKKLPKKVEEFNRKQ